MRACSPAGNLISPGILLIRRQRASWVQLVGGGGGALRGPLSVSRPRQPHCPGHPVRVITCFIPIVNAAAIRLHNQPTLIFFSSYIIENAFFKANVLCLPSLLVSGCGCWHIMKQNGISRSVQCADWEEVWPPRHSR